MAEYRLPFLEEDVAALYDRIRVPHPTDLNVGSNPSLSAVVNDLLIPGSAFFFRVTPQTPITASRDGVVYTVRRDGLYSDAHATNLIVIEHEDGSAVRIEHLDPVYEVGDVVRAGDIVGLPKGYLGAPHIHWYSLQSPDHSFPDNQVAFSNVPARKVNTEYEAIDNLLIQFSQVPGLKTTSYGKRWTRAVQPQAVSPEIIDTIGVEIAKPHVAKRRRPSTDMPSPQDFYSNPGLFLSKEELAIVLAHLDRVLGRKGDGI